MSQYIIQQYNDAMPPICPCVYLTHSLMESSRMHVFISLTVWWNHLACTCLSHLQFDGIVKILFIIYICLLWFPVNFEIKASYYSFYFPSRFLLIFWENHFIIILYLGTLIGNCSVLFLYSLYVIISDAFIYRDNLFFWLIVYSYGHIIILYSFVFWTIAGVLIRFVFLNIPVLWSYVIFIHTVVHYCRW